MEIHLSVVIALLALHFLGDFVLQSDWMAINKSKRFDALLVHATVYSLCFVPLGFAFYVITLATHAAVDAYTSRLSAKCWANNERHWFFVVIGWDQLVHYMTLLYTYVYLFGG